MQAQRVCAAILAAGVAGLGQAAAASYTFKNIAAPGAAFTFVSGINDAGTIVGGADTRGYVLSGGVYSFIAAPGAMRTSPGGISADGTITGYTVASDNSYHGFTYAGGTFGAFDVPGAIFGANQGTFPFSINSSGVIGGTYTTASGTMNGFVKAGGVFTTVAPSSTGVSYVVLNDSGMGAGYEGATGTFGGNAFTYDYATKTLTPVKAPAAATFGINFDGIANNGDIIGQYYTNGTFLSGIVNFIYRDGGFTILPDAPGAIGTTNWVGINDYGDIVGEIYGPSGPMFAVEGVPVPEPAALALLSAGLVGLFAARGRAARPTLSGSYRPV